MVSASGSEKISAASAEASTTLKPVTISPYDVGRIGRRAETEAPDFSEEFARAQIPLRLNGLLDNGEQLALQRPMVPLGPPPQPFNDVVGSVLDR